MNVKAVMTASPVTVTSRTSLDNAQALMDEHLIRHLPVVDHEELVGILSDRDLLEANGWLPFRMHACRGPAKSDSLPKHVEEILHASVVTASPGDELVQSALIMLSRRIGCLPVVEDEKLVGIVTEMDVLGALRGSLLESSARESTQHLVAAQMTSMPVTINWYASLAAAVDLCQSNRIRHLPVLENSQLVGIVSDRDLRRAKGQGRPDQIPVCELMTKKTVTISPEATLITAAERMHSSKYSALPVVLDRELIGILTLSDLLEQYLSLQDA